MNTLSYTSATSGWVPIPASERELPFATAEPFFKVADNALPLEGPAFDRQGNLLFVDIYGGRVLKLSPGGELSHVHSDKNLNPAGIAVHKDGRIFVAAGGARNSKGRFDAGTVIAMNADGSNVQTIIAPSAGYVPNDLVFDEHGGFYMSDFRGASTRAEGGILYMSPDFQTLTPVLRPSSPHAGCIAPTSPRPRKWRPPARPSPTSSSGPEPIRCVAIPTAMCMWR